MRKRVFGLLLLLCVVLACALAYDYRFVVQDVLRFAAPRTQMGRRVRMTGELAANTAPLLEILRKRGVTKPKDVSLEIIKSQRMLRLWVNGNVIKTYVIALGHNCGAKKTQRDDYATPEGDYYVCDKHPGQYEYSLTVSYPNIQDARAGYRRGLIDEAVLGRIETANRRRKAPPFDTKLGGIVAIHGGGAGILHRVGGVTYMDVYDWTQGCMALRRRDAKELYDFVPVRTPIHIRP